MNRLYTTELPIEECKKRLKENLKPTVYGYWWQDVFVGKVVDNTYKLYFHKAYINNSFSKTVKGKFYIDNNKKYVTAKTSTLFISPKIYLIIFIIISTLSFIEQLSNGFKYGIWDYIETVLFFFIPSSLFLLFIGIVSSYEPTNHKDKVIEFLEKVFELDEVCNNSSDKK